MFLYLLACIARHYGIHNRPLQQIRDVFKARARQGNSRVVEGFSKKRPSPQYMKCISYVEAY